MHLALFGLSLPQAGIWIGPQPFLMSADAHAWHSCVKQSGQVRLPVWSAESSAMSLADKSISKIPTPSSVYSGFETEDKTEMLCIETYLSKTAALETLCFFAIAPTVGWSIGTPAESELNEISWMLCSLAYVITS